MQFYYNVFLFVIFVVFIGQVIANLAKSEFM